MPAVDPEELKEFIEEALTKLEVKKEDAKDVADHLVLANLFGVHTHGIVRLSYYVRAMQNGSLNPASQTKIVKENDTMLFLDGDSGLGQPAAMEVTRRAIEKAHDNYIGIGSAVNLGHVGMLAHYSYEVVKEGMIGLSVANTPSVLAPMGAKEPFLGTNPIAIGLPYKEQEHILFDSAMSVTSRGKILVAREKGEQIPDNWALDEEGKPTTDPDRAAKGAMLPDGVKGYALSLIIDLFCGAVMGGKFGHEIPANFASQGAFTILVINPEFFRDKESYMEDLQDYLQKLKSLPTSEDCEEIRVPGESKFKKLEEGKKGIQLDESTVSTLNQLAESIEMQLRL